jgi:hypothetical protein
LVDFVHRQELQLSEKTTFWWGRLFQLCENVYNFNQTLTTTDPDLSSERAPHKVTAVTVKQ